MNSRREASPTCTASVRERTVHVVHHDRRRASRVLDGGHPHREGRTTRADGRPHAAPVWFVLDGDDVIFTTGEGTVKGRTLRHDPRVSVVVDSDQPPFAFVVIDGIAEISHDQAELLRWATALVRATWVPTVPKSSGGGTRARGAARPCPALARRRHRRDDRLSSRHRAAGTTPSATS